MQKYTILTKYKIADIEKILNISREEARELKTNPEAKLSLKQFSQLSPEMPHELIPREIVLRRKRAKQHVSKFRLPKDLKSLAVEVLDPPGEVGMSRRVKVQYGRARTFTGALLTDISVDDGQLILNDIFQQTFYKRQKGITQEEWETAYYWGVRAEDQLKKVFGDDYYEFRDLFTKEKRSVEELYGFVIPVRSNPAIIYGVIDYDDPIGQDRFDKKFAPVEWKGYKTARTKNPYFLKRVLRQIDKSLTVEMLRDNSIIVRTLGGQLLAVGKIVGDEIEYVYPANDRGEHIFWTTPFISIRFAQLTQERRVFFTKNLKVEEIIETKPKSLVILSNGLYLRTYMSKEDIDELLTRPVTVNRDYPDFSKYPASILW